MLKYLSEDVKDIFKISFLLSGIIFLFGIIFRIPELYYGMFVGSLGGIINFYFITKSKMYLVRSGDPNYLSKTRIDFAKRYVFTMLFMISAILISKKFDIGNHIYNIITIGIGFLNVKFSIFINEVFKKKGE